MLKLPQKEVLRRVSNWVWICLLIGTAFIQQATTAAVPVNGRTRTYYIAADEVDWDYAPPGKDLIHGEKYHFQDDPASKGTLNPNANRLSQSALREYTDADFRTLMPRSEAWAHLGILGPLIRAEVGDTIKVVFKNNASHDFSVRPHGVFYAKSSEGADYQDESRSLSALRTIRESQLNQAVVRQQYTRGYGIGRAISCSITKGSFGSASVRPVRTNPSRS
jgi:hypothetical protein